MEDLKHVWKMTFRRYKEQEYAQLEELTRRFKMADTEVSGEGSSHISVKSEGNNDVTNCKKCSEHETQIKETLDELISIQMINELL